MEVGEHRKRSNSKRFTGSPRVTTATPNLTNLHPPSYCVMERAFGGGCSEFFVGVADGL